MTGSAALLASGIAPAQHATGVLSLVWLVVALPAAGALALLLGGRRTDRWGHWLGLLAVVGAFAVAAVLFVALLGRSSDARSYVTTAYRWIPVGRFQVDVAMLLDPLSITFILLITGVGALIHLYSVGYLAHDPRRRLFFAYLNLFVASMLLLVTSADYLVTYVGWEGVGLSSYVLIGFWQYKPTAATAAKKAFVANRVGDVGFSLAIMLMFATFGATSYAGVWGAAGRAAGGTVTAICLLLVLGAIAKSAQVPLQVWLLDAMEGPTPVSALIHAATMVTAGVYLIVRSNPLFNLSSTAQLVVAVIGTVTLLVGAWIGSAMDDIKKSLAGSTMSQIGYMFLAAGLGAAGYAYAIFLLVVHGFFKADLFLGAGSVMHAMDDDVDMRRYGGLGRVMPQTFATFAAGYLMIVGFPWYGHISAKDDIVEVTFDRSGWQGWVFGIAAALGALITAYYMTRMLVMTFLGQRRWRDGQHPHESGAVLTLPMWVLAIGSVVASVVLWDRLPAFLAPSIGEVVEEPARIRPFALSTVLFVLVVLTALAAFWQYARRRVPQTAPATHDPLVVAARHQLYGDAVNEALLMRPGQYATRALVYVDNRGVDGLVNALAATVGGSSGRLRRVQNGFVRSYALIMFGGVAVALGLMALVAL